MSSTECCPIGSEKAFAATYKPKGEEITLNGLKCYTNGNSNKGIIVYYDIFGYNGGRTKLICDQLAAAGFTVYLPDVFHGDAWPVDKPKDESIMTWLKNFTWESTKNDTQKVLKHMEEKGVLSVGCLGFCWGAWAVFHACHSEKMKCGASMHPSIHTLTSVFNEKADELTELVKCPQLVYAAGGDPPMYKENGEVYNILQAKFPGRNDIKEFKDMNHGFVSRGDLNRPETERDVKAAMEGSIAFFKKYL